MPDAPGYSSPSHGRALPSAPCSFIKCSSKKTRRLSLTRSAPDYRVPVAALVALGALVADGVSVIVAIFVAVALPAAVALLVGRAVAVVARCVAVARLLIVAFAAAVLVANTICWMPVAVILAEAVCVIISI